MDRRKKPKLHIEPEEKRTAPPFAVKEVTAPKPIQIRPESSVIRLPATAEELAERRKPQLQIEKTESKDLPFAVTSEPLPAPRPEMFPEPSMPLRVEEKDFLNQGSLQTEDEKARHVFLTNYCATYGNVSAEEGERAFREFQAKLAYSKAVSRNPELRMQQSELFRRVTQIPLSVHIVILGIQFAIFAYLRLKADF
jgi:hypothetical protein